MATATTTLERPKTETETKTAPAPVTPPRNMEQAVIISLRPKNFAAERLSTARDLQQQYERIRARYDGVLASPSDREYANCIQRDPATPRSLRDFEEEKTREIASLHKQMNVVANKAMEINAGLSAEFARVILKAVDDFIAEEKKPFEKFGCVALYSESPLVQLLRKLFFRFNMAAQKTTTTADVNGSPKVILSAFFDL